MSAVGVLQNEAGDAAVRESLTRVLAREGRSALSRVELAASALARTGANPADRDRLEAIREAVTEIDELLGKIDILAGPPDVARWAAIDVRAAFQRVLMRLSPTLFARGARIGLAPGAEAVQVAMPEATLEAILCGYLRLLLGPSIEGFEASIDVRSIDGAVRIVALEPGAEGRLVSEPGVAPSAVGSIEREARVEFEVLLAEWGGALAAPAFWLPQAVTETSPGESLAGFPAESSEVSS